MVEVAMVEAAMVEGAMAVAAMAGGGRAVAARAVEARAVGEVEVAIMEEALRGLTVDHHALRRLKLHAAVETVEAAKVAVATALVARGVAVQGCPGGALQRGRLARLSTLPQVAVEGPNPGPEAAAAVSIGAGAGEGASVDSEPRGCAQDHFEPFRATQARRILVLAASALGAAPKVVVGLGPSP